MSSKLSDKDWIKSFNEFSREFYFQRYKAIFKPTSAISVLFYLVIDRKLK